MSNTLYGYMSPFELELAREDAKLELEGSRLIYEYAMLEKEHELMLEEIELKSIVMEGCTSDDLYMMYEDENESNEEKKEGIISKIWNWLKNIFNAIIGKTKKAILVIEANTKYAIDYSIDKLNAILDDVKKVIEDVRRNKGNANKFFPNKLKKYPQIKDIVDVDNDKATINSDKYMEKIKDDESGPTLGSKLKSELENLENKCKDIINTINAGVNNLVEAIGDFLENIVTKINGTISNMLNKINNESNDSNNNNSDSSGDDGKKVDADKVLNGIKDKFNDDQLKQIEQSKNEVKDVITNAITNGITDIAGKVKDFLSKKKEEGQNTKESAHDIDDVYSSIFESLDIDTIDSTFEESYSESHDDDLNAFIDILDDLLQ